MSDENFKFWKKVWDSKGNSDSSDLLFLDGYEHIGANFNSAEIASSIIETLGIQEGATILEVACGCGFLSREFNKKYKYVGVDYSAPIIEKHKQMFKHEVYVSESNRLLFDDGSFEYVFCYGLFQYLPNEQYAISTILEMDRVSSKGILIGDLKNKKTRDTHFVFPKNRFKDHGMKIIKNADFDNAQRYNAYKIKEM